MQRVSERVSKEAPVPADMLASGQATGIGRGRNKTKEIAISFIALWLSLKKKIQYV